MADPRKHGDEYPSPIKDGEFIAQLCADDRGDVAKVTCLDRRSYRHGGGDRCIFATFNCK
jgi:hypothetical protein